MVRKTYPPSPTLSGARPPAPTLSGDAVRLRLDERIALGEDLDKLTDAEVIEYVAYVFDGCALLKGGIGPLPAARVTALAARLRLIGAAHQANVRIKTNWAAGPREES